MPQLLPALALGMKVYYHITLTAVILKYIFSLGRICLLGRMLSYFLTYSLGKKNKKIKMPETSLTTEQIKFLPMRGTCLPFLNTIIIIRGVAQS